MRNPRPAPTMTLTSALSSALTTAFILTLMVTVAQAQQKAPEQGKPTPTPQTTNQSQPDPVAKAADEALGKLVAWNHQAARQVLDSKKESGKSSAAYLAAEGLALAQEGKLDQGISKLGEAAAKDKADPAPSYFLGEVWFWRQKMDKATPAWKEAVQRAKAQLSKDPDNARALFYLGAAQVRTMEFAAARDNLDKAQNKGFDPTLVAFQKGLSFSFDKKWDPAKTWLSKVIDADASFAHAYFYRALVWEKLGRKDSMLNDMDKFVKLAPDAPEAQTARAILSAAGR